MSLSSINPADIHSQAMAHVITETLNTPEFLEQYDRLRGTSFSKSAHPMAHMVDVATGKFERDALRLFEDIIDLVWDRLPASPETRT